MLPLARTGEKKANTKRWHKICSLILQQMNLQKIFFVFAAAVMSLTYYGCGGGTTNSMMSMTSSTPTTPAAVNIEGTWTGKLSSTQINGGESTMTMTFTQNDSSVSGTYTCVSGTMTCSHSGAAMTGMMSGNTMSMQMTFSDNQTCGTFTGTVSGNTMTGQYNCMHSMHTQVADSGTWTMTKQ